jgi:hypothetical protein
MRDSNSGQICYSYPELQIIIHVITILYKNFFVKGVQCYWQMINRYQIWLSLVSGESCGNKFHILYNFMTTLYFYTIYDQFIMVGESISNNFNKYVLISFFEIPRCHVYRLVTGLMHRKNKIFNSLTFND